MGELHTFKVQINGQVRRGQFDGADHLIAPVIAIREGVLNGELVPANEINHFVDAWNGIPLVINHPTDAGGNFISANEPAVLEKSGVGQFFNAEFKDNGLSGEIFFRVEKADRLGGEAKQAFNMLDSGAVVEVSTGYFTDVEASNGDFKGQAFRGVNRNIRPDHLALLPNDIGACSVSGGCGAGRANTENSGNNNDLEVQAKSIATRVMDKLAGALGLRLGSTDKPKLRFNKEDAMDRETMIKALIAGGTFVESEAEVLKNLSDERITALHAKATCKCNEEVAEVPAVVETPAAAPATETDVDAATIEEKVEATADPEVKALMKRALKQQASEKADFVKLIKANKNNKFSDEQLNGFEIDMLETLSESMTGQDYSGRGAPRTQAVKEQTSLQHPDIFAQNKEAA